jgi:hypothetical protein
LSWAFSPGVELGRSPRRTVLGDPIDLSRSDAE